MSKSVNGFSLLEVLVALVIVSLTLTSALALTAQLTRGAARVSERAIAESLAGFTLQRAIAERNDHDVALAVYATPFNRFQYEVRITPAPHDMRVYTVYVVGRFGAASMSRMARGPIVGPS